MNGDEGPGPTGLFPEGKLNEGDEGELTIGVSVKAGLVHIDFGKLVGWLAMRPEGAEEFARELLACAEEARRK